MSRPAGRKFEGGWSPKGSFVNGQWVDDEPTPQMRNIEYDLSPERMERVWARCSIFGESKNSSIFSWTGTGPDGRRLKKWRDRGNLKESEKSSEERSMRREHEWLR